MKDIEKIKSEDLACQVADANPGNFAIEQELAQLVGATVPQPTEPSADDARELGAQLLVFLRRALTPIQTALRTALADIYAHLDSRCTDYTPAGYAPYLPLPSYDPMRPFVPRTLPNLLTALTAFSARKISNGSAPSDGIPDGISLAHLLGSRSMVTKIDDDNHGWVCDSVMPNFPNLVDATLRMKSITAANALNNLGASGKVTMPELTTITSGASQYNDPMPLNATEIYADDVETSDAIFSQKSYPNLQKVSMKKVRSFNGRSFYDLQAEGPLKEVYLPELRTYDTWAFLLDYSGTRDKYLSLILLEIGSDVSCNISNWNPTEALRTDTNSLVVDEWTIKPEGVDVSNWKNLDLFLYNFREHIALRLAQQPADNPNHLTLTLSAAVYNAVTGANSGWASLHTLADLGITTDDLTELEQELGITTATLYSTWLDTYTGANGIHWNVNKAN